MAAPKGNQFWMLRSKHGKDKNFKTPESLRQACFEFFKEAGELFLNEQNWVGKDGNEVMKYHPIPFTLQWLCNYLDITITTWGNYKKDNDYLEVCTRAEQIIYIHKFSYAATGFFNHSIIARDLGLADKKELQSGGEAIKPTIIVSNQQSADNLQKLINGSKDEGD